MIKILDKIEINFLKLYYFDIQNSIKWQNFTKCKQASLQYKDDENPDVSGLGKGNGTDLMYRNINENYKNTIFEELIIKYNLTRTRLMLVEPWSCYSMHRDTTPRIHIPIITNPECYFVFKSGKIEHLSEGFVYWVDTTKFHTFINCSDKQRIHLVASVEI